MDRNKDLFEKSLHTIPGGVNSPVRAFGSVGGTPIFLKKLEAAVCGMRMIKNTSII